MSNILSNKLNNKMNNNVIQYLNNNYELDKIRRCVNDIETSPNIYKTVASFEDANIINVTDVPLGDSKVKINYLLANAISSATSIVTNNIKLASTIAAEWGEDTVVGLQQERLNATMSKLQSPLKSIPIPAYSALSEGQRARVLEIFNKAIDAKEPVSIDFVSEAIDRYNSGANSFVMFKALNITIDYGTAVGKYDTTIYDGLMTESTYHYLYDRFSKFDEELNKLCSEDGKFKKQYEVNDLIEVLSDIKKSNNLNTYRMLSNLHKGLEFTKPTDEYTRNYSDKTTHGQIKQFIADGNVIKPFSKNDIDRLDGLCNLVKHMGKLTLPNVNVEASSASTDDMYDVLSSYFSFIEELTLCLTTYMFISQVATRNNKMLEDVIIACNMLVTKITALFDEVNNAIPEDNSVTQESFSAVINYIKDKINKPRNLNACIQEFDIYTRLQQRYIVNVNDFSKLKLRGFNKPSTNEIRDFRKKHSKLLKTMLDYDISKFTDEELYNSISSNLLTSENGLLTNGALNIKLLNAEDKSSRGIRDLIINESKIQQVMEIPFSNTTTKTFISAARDLEDHLNQVVNSIKSNDVNEIKFNLANLDYYLKEGSYYRNVTKLTDANIIPTLNTIPRIPCTSPIDNKTYTVGYQLPMRESQELLLDSFKQDVKYNVSAMDLENNFTKKICEMVAYLYTLNDKLNVYKVGVTSIERNLKVLYSIKKILPKTRDLDGDYNELIDCIINDSQHALADIKLRINLASLFYNASFSTLTILCNFYRQITPLMEDFLTTYK